MDFKKIVDQAEDLKEKAEAKIKEARDTFDKNHDNIPDALEGLTEKGKTLAGQAQGKAKIKFDETKGAAQKAMDSARKRMGRSDKDIKKG